MTHQPIPERRVKAAWLIVARREIIAQLTDKAFWIGTLSTLAIIVLSFLVVGLMGGETSPSKVAVSTDTAEAVVTQATRTGGNVAAVRVDDDLLRTTVEDGEADAALSYTESDGWLLAVKNLSDAPDLAEAVRTVQIESNSVALGVDAGEVLAGTTLTTVPLDGDDGTALAIIVATFAFSILFMLAAVTYGMQIAQSVVTEKESRIVEILAAAVPIRSLLIGKVVGNTLMALSQVILLVTVSLVGLSFTPYKPLIALVAPVAGWFVLFFLVGFAALACLWAAAGAMATRVQDLSQTTTPLMMVVMAAYMTGLFARGTVAEVLSYVPITSTVIMPGRLLSGEADWVNALLALFVAAAFMGLAIWIGALVYRRSLMQTNSVMSYRQLFSRTD
ncbi:ABC-2 type transport system permease protein [Tessaracoccus bendigoensis DSM 12906]|uniref:ABC-2 type transport system permease protein n=1 Tax=Tessaracoccus bendigoensis DSM 12906 TaxID=1123357 RepID=A0A1M6AUQ9_9ACTN|nr:ABC transporter permease [Tessaracoccus bendigoensis]SHI40244.1 ABC-2 type transport system permease protein [Tessaracoccus bendigoensis DSM 12906]